MFGPTSSCHNLLARPSLYCMERLADNISVGTTPPSNGRCHNGLNKTTALGPTLGKVEGGFSPVRATRCTSIISLVPGTPVDTTSLTGRSAPEEVNYRDNSPLDGTRLKKESAFMAPLPRYAALRPGNSAAPRYAVRVLALIAIQCVLVQLPTRPMNVKGPIPSHTLVTTQQNTMEYRLPPIELASPPGIAFTLPAPTSDDVVARSICLSDLVLFVVPASPISVWRNVEIPSMMGPQNTVKARGRQSTVPYAYTSRRVTLARSSLGTVSRQATLGMGLRGRRRHHCPPIPNPTTAAREGRLGGMAHLHERVCAALLPGPRAAAARRPST